MTFVTSKTRWWTSSTRESLSSRRSADRADFDCLTSEDMAKKDAEELARAQRIADGKERNKRGALDLDDDDFDDDWGVSKRPRQQKQRVDNMTTAELSE